MNQEQQSNQKIQIKVSIPQLKSEFGGAAKHHVYPISGFDKLGDISIARRYSDFDTLKIVLVARWPGVYIPSLPEKKIIGNNDLLFVQIRRQGLQYFMSILSSMPYIWYSEEFQIFLRSTGDCQKNLLKLKQNNLTNILIKYRQIFPDYLNKEVSKQINTNLIEFGQYLKKAIGLLQNLQKMTEQIFNSRKKANQKYFHLMQQLLPQYEKNCISTYKSSESDSEFIFSKKNTEEKNVKISQLSYLTQDSQNNSVIYVLQEIKRQKLQIKAFQEVLKTKEMYSVLRNKSISKVKDLQIETSKINAGKQSIFAKITKKSKEQQLKQNELNIQKAAQEQNNLALMSQVIVALIGYSEIDRFKKLRQTAYYNLLKKYCQMQLQQSKKKRFFWTEIGKGQNVKIQVQKSNQNIEIREEKQQSDLSKHESDSNLPLKDQQLFSHEKVQKQQQQNSKYKQVSQQLNTFGQINQQQLQQQNYEIQRKSTEKQEDISQ